MWVVSTPEPSCRRSTVCLLPLCQPVAQAAAPGASWQVQVFSQYRDVEHHSIGNKFRSILLTMEKHHFKNFCV